MEVKIRQCDEFYTTWKYLENFNSEVNCVFSEAEMYIQIFDSAHTVIADITFPCEYFEEYKCDKPINVGVNVKTLLLILKNTYKKNVVLSMSTTSTSDDLTIRITSEDGFKCSYVLKMVDIHQEALEIPELNVYAKYTVSYKTLKKWKDHLYDKSDISLFPSKEAMQVECKDELNNSLQLRDEIEPIYFENSKKRLQDKDWKQKIIAGGNTNFLYALLAFNKDINFEFFVSEAPLLVSVNLKDDVHLRTFIAPKISDEDPSDFNEDESDPKRMRIE